MAIDKNFVVKHGLEVARNLVFADAGERKVGIASTVPQFTLDVAGGIGATDIYAVGVVTFTDTLRVGSGGTTLTVLGIGGSIGVGNPDPEYLLDVRSPVSTGQTALYVYGDAKITGDISIDDINLDQASANRLYVTQNIDLQGTGTLYVASGISTFGGRVDINESVDISDNLIVGGATTLTGPVSVGNSVTITGSYYGDGSTISGFPAGRIGVASEGVLIGTAVTQIDFATSTGTNVEVSAPSSGVSTVTITPGITLGLAIALGA
jgi:hypothetical protein